LKWFERASVVGWACAVASAAETCRQVSVDQFNSKEFKKIKNRQPDHPF
jgi:hypothetical protein